MAKFTISSVFEAVDRLSGPVKTMRGNVNGFGKDSKKAFDGVTKSANLIKGAIAGAVGAFVTGKMLSFGREALNLASDLTEVQNVIDTTFGADSAKQVNAWSKSAMTNFGLSELSAKKFNGTLGAMLKSSGLSGDALVEMSTKLSGLAGDFASFYNLDAEDAFAKIRSGISGETEPLKQLGINMSVANMETFAMTKGIRKAWKEMSQAEQVNLRYLYILQASSDAQGDFSKTLSTSYANQKRVLETNLQQVAANAMTSVLPIALKYSTALNETVAKIGAWVEINKEMIGQKIDSVISGVVTAMKALVSAWDSGLIPALIAGIAAYKTMSLLMIAMPPVIAAVKAAMFAYSAVAGGAATVQEVLNLALAANPIGLIIIGIAALVAGIVLLVKNWETVWSVMKSFGAWIASGFVAYLRVVATILDTLLAPLRFIIETASKLGGGSGIKVPKLGDMIPDGATPVSPQTTGIESRQVTESRSSLDVNFNSMPPGTSTRQTGSAPGININTYPAFGGPH